MHHLHIGFVESVKWLKNRIPATPVQNKASGSNPQPTSVGDILAQMIPTPAHVKSDTPVEQSVSKRLSALEDSVRHLYHLIDVLRSFLEK